MTARQGKWRVAVRNFSPVTNIDEFDSFDAALEFEGPDGVAIDDEDLARCCALANQK